MLFIFILFMVAVAISFLFLWDAEPPRKVTEFFQPFGIALAIATGLLCIIWGISYTEYLEQKTFFDGTCEQYASAVTMYSDYAEIDMESAAWTDLKYQGYQDNVSGFIRSLRDNIIKYNKGVISKRIMAENPFFSWLIVGPDESMLVLKMSAVTK